MENRTLKERLADSEWVKNWFDQAGPEAVKEIERLEVELAEAYTLIVDMRSDIADGIDYFDIDPDLQKHAYENETAGEKLNKAFEKTWDRATKFMKGK